MRMNYTNFMDRKQKFFRKHDSDFTIRTSTMNEYGGYHKEYVFSDGAIWYEVYDRITREVIVDTDYNCKVKVDVEFFRTESWNTDNAKSVYMYEQF